MKQTIIGINGRIGSGKDLTALMIQRLYLVQGIEAGLYTPEICPTLEQLAQGYKVLPSFWEVKKFAGKLKQVASLLTGISVDKFEDQEFKKTELGEEWSYLFDNEHLGGAWKNVMVKMTVREFLQKLGTEAVRDGLHINTWCNALFADWKPELQQKWLITDMRFPNEFDAVEQRGGITVRVNRKKLNKENTARLHPSETSLDNHFFDYEILNNGTLEELEAQIKQILITEKFL